jgi:hypothetical protein
MTHVPPELRRVKQGVERELLNRPGVVGVDIGYKEVGGQPTDEIAIRVLVEHKRDVPDPQAIPTSIEGHTTDVIERKYELHILTAFASETVSRTDTGAYDPVQGGISIGPCRPISGVTYTGTLGAVVTDNVTGQPMLLGNYHVMAINDKWAIGDGISQPSRPDAGICPGSIVGTLERAVMTDKVDCAVAKATKSTRCEIVEIGALTGTATASLDQVVRKRGRTSGLTYGKIDTVDLTLQIDYGAGPHIFTNQIGIMPDVERNPAMGTHGDSGSVLVTEDGAVVGLYFGGDAKTGHGVANPIDAVLSALNVSLCTVPARPSGGQEQPPATQPVGGPTQPGATSPGTPPQATQPGTTSPGTPPQATQPGATSPGTPPQATQPGATSPGTPPQATQPGATSPGTPPQATQPGATSPDGPKPAASADNGGGQPPPWPVWPAGPIPERPWIPPEMYWGAPALEAFHRPPPEAYWVHPYGGWSPPLPQSLWPPPWLARCYFGC